MKKLFSLLLLIFISKIAFPWGFFGHRLINRTAVFLLPPEMLILYKPYTGFLEEHSTDPDKRRYALPEEGPRHYIDIDQYGISPFDSLPRRWIDAVTRYSEDSLHRHGIVPWWIQTMLYRLTNAFKEKNQSAILRLSAEIGHYIADAHVPLHTTRNHNGQYTGQHGIHGLWESRIPELLADHEWDFFIGKASYINNPIDFTWNRIKESAAAADTVLRIEKMLTNAFSPDRKYSFEERNGVVIRQYSSDFCRQYETRLHGMIERRMQQAIFAVASFWHTAWVNAGQPDLTKLTDTIFTPEEQNAFDVLNQSWKRDVINGREH
jgi:hypothetical protein